MILPYYTLYVRKQCVFLAWGHWRMLGNKKLCVAFCTCFCYPHADFLCGIRGKFPLLPLLGKCLKFLFTTRVLSNKAVLVLAKHLVLFWGRMHNALERFMTKVGLQQESEWWNELEVVKLNSIWFLCAKRESRIWNKLQKRETVKFVYCKVV